VERRARWVLSRVLGDLPVTTLLVSLCGRFPPGVPVPWANSLSIYIPIALAVGGLFPPARCRPSFTITCRHLYHLRSPAGYYFRRLISATHSLLQCLLPRDITIVCVPGSYRVKATITRNCCYHFFQNALLSLLWRCILTHETVEPFMLTFTQIRIFCRLVMHTILRLHPY